MNGRRCRCRCVVLVEYSFRMNLHHYMCDKMITLSQLISIFTNSHICMVDRLTLPYQRQKTETSHNEKRCVAYQEAGMCIVSAVSPPLRLSFVFTLVYVACIIHFIGAIKWLDDGNYLEVIIIYVVFVLKWKQRRRSPSGHIFVEVFQSQCFWLGRIMCECECRA